MSRKIVIDGKIIYTDKIHFVRRESDKSLLISFGVDFLKFQGSKEKIDSIFSKLQDGNNEEFSGKR